MNSVTRSALRDISKILQEAGWAEPKTPLKRIHVQIQPNRCKDLNVDLAIERLRNLSENVKVSEGDDNGPYVNIDYQTDSLLNLWTSIRNELNKNIRLAEAAMVICEGQRGYDDYLLLHHFDPSEELDELT